jgi:hypothetical protein
MKKKKRIELQIDREKDKDVVYFLENRVDNQAGFIKHLLREYVIHMQRKQQVEGEVNSNHMPYQEVDNEVSKNESEDDIDMSFLSMNAYSSDDFK